MTYIEFLLVFAAIVGIATYFSGRQLKSHRDDPLVAERMVKHKTRLGVIYFAIFIGNPGLASLAGIFGIGMDVPENMPMIQLLSIDAGLILVSFCVDYFQKKAVLGQTWTLAEAITHSVRFVIALSGFWLILFFVPAFVKDSGRFMWEAAVGFSVLLVGWSYFFDRLTPFLLKNSSLIDSQTSALFSDIIARAKAPEPKIYAIHTEKGNFYNAFAIPAMPRPTVLISRSILKHFLPDEIRAVFAHEMAHLEEFPKQRILLAGLIEKVVIIAGCFSVPIFSFFNASFINEIQIFWIVVVLFYFFLRNKGQQGREHYSDIRAAELSGNTAATISGLIKLHTASLTPRRTDMQSAADSTHPSLSKRIRAIRQHLKTDEADEKADPEAGQKPWTTVIDIGRKVRGYNQVHIGETCLTLTTVENRSNAEPGIYLENDPVQIDLLLKGAMRQNRISYSKIVELRIIIKGKKFALRIVEKTGQKFEIPIPPDGLKLLQQALDRVDHNIPEYTKSVATGMEVSRLFTFFSGIMVLILMPDLQSSPSSFLIMILLCIFNFVKRTPVSMAGFAGGSLAFVLHGFFILLAAEYTLGKAWILLMFVGLIGCFHLFLLKKQIHDKHWPDVGGYFPAKTGLVMLGVGFVFIVPNIIPLFSAHGAMRLYSFANATRGVFILIPAASSILLISPNGYLKATGLFFVLASIIQPVFGTELFLQQCTDDCWATSRKEQTMIQIPYEPQWEIVIEDYFWNLSVSPTGRYAQFDREPEGEEGNYQIFTSEGKLRTYSADYSAFTDDGHVLTLTESVPSGCDLEYKSLPGLETKWKKHLAPLATDYDTVLLANSDRWRIQLGDYPSDPAQWDGSLFDDQCDIKTWKRKKGYFTGQEVSGNDYILAWDTENSNRLFSSAPWAFLLGALNEIKTYKFRSPENELDIGFSSMYARTYCPAPGFSDFLVGASSNAKTYVWLIDGKSMNRSFIGAFKDYRDIAWNGQWMAVSDDEAVFLINPYQNLHYRIELPDREEYGPSIALGREVIAIATEHRQDDPDAMRVCVFKIPGV